MSRRAWSRWELQAFPIARNDAWTATFGVRLVCRQDSMPGFLSRSRRVFGRVACRRPPGALARGPCDFEYPRRMLTRPLGALLLAFAWQACAAGEHGSLILHFLQLPVGE